MTGCSVPRCSSKSYHGIGVFSLPRNEEARKKWLQFLQYCGKLIKDVKNFTICEHHFDERSVECDVENQYFIEQINVKLNRQLQILFSISLFNCFYSITIIRRCSRKSGKSKN